MRVPTTSGVTAHLPRQWKLLLGCGVAFILLLWGSSFKSNGGATASIAQGVGGNPNDEYAEDDPGNVSAEQNEQDENKDTPKSKQAMAQVAADGAQCMRKMHFLPWNQQRKHPVALASFPGSGNTWLRFLVEQGSRVYTGSVYHDKDLNATYPGEGLEDSQLIAVKTHYPCPNCWTYQKCSVCAGGNPVTAPMTGPVVDADAAVFMLRSPFDALLAEFNRIRTGKHAGELSPADFTKTPKRKPYETAFDQPGWNDFINQRLVAYAKAARTYLDHPTKAKSPKDLPPPTSNGVSSDDVPKDLDEKKVLFENSDRFVSKGGRLTKLVFYERLKADPAKELEKVFLFFQDLYEAEGIKDAIITPPSLAAKCALDHYKAAAATHFVWERKHTKRFNPWLPGQVKIVCNALGKWWFEDVWGRCMDGKLQWERTGDGGATTSSTSSSGGGNDGGD